MKGGGDVGSSSTSALRCLRARLIAPHSILSPVLFLRQTPFIFHPALLLPSSAASIFGLALLYQLRQTSSTFPFGRCLSTTPRHLSCRPMPRHPSHFFPPVIPPSSPSYLELSVPSLFASYFHIPSSPSCLPFSSRPPPSLSQRHRHQRVLEWNFDKEGEGGKCGRGEGNFYHKERTQKSGNF